MNLFFTNSFYKQIMFVKCKIFTTVFSLFRLINFANVISSACIYKKKILLIIQLQKHTHTKKEEKKQKKQTKNKQKNINLTIKTFCVFLGNSKGNCSCNMFLSS